MPQALRERPCVLFLYTETGGTHRNAAEAIAEAIEIEYPDQFDLNLVDIWKFSSWPYNLLPGLLHRLGDNRLYQRIKTNWSASPHPIKLFNRLSHFYSRRMIDQLLKQYPCDLAVAVHPLAAAPVLSALEQKKAFPFAIVVTDLASRNIFWYDKRADLLVVPTDEARKNALLAGIPWQHLQQIGIPVSMEYCVTLEDRADLRQRLGLPVGKPVVLLVSGKNGVGPVEDTAAIIDEEMEEISLVIITGRNQPLRKRLSRYNWKNHVVIEGYVEQMSEWMWAADVLVSKAGTGMIGEAINVGLPLILFHRMPYLEDANVSFIVSEGVGVWAPTPRMVVNTLKQWLSHPDHRKKVVNACRRMAAPQSARQLALLFSEMAQEHEQVE